MKTSGLLVRILAILSIVALTMAAYLLWARPYQLRWGATDAEVNRVMPGDELDPAPTFLATRAITINGTPAEIWPWLIQIGYQRAGFYGYDILENLGSTRGMASADHILPEFQHFKVGDDVLLSSVARLSFRAIEPNQYLIWSGAEPIAPGGFTWALYPLDAQHTRLVSRIRWSHHWTKPDLLALDLFTEFTDHLAVRKILDGVKGRVEGRSEPMAQGNTEFVIYLAAAMIFLGAVVVILLRPLTWYRWLAGLTAGVAWLITWYAPVSIWFAAALELLVVLVLFSAAQQRFHAIRRKEDTMTQTSAHNTPPRLFRLFLKAQNPFMIWLLRSPFHVVVSRIYMLITFTGRKSGRVYTTPVQYAQQGEVLSIITSDGYSWWKNLRGGVDVHVHMRGTTYPGHAETSTDPQLINTLLQKIYPRLSSTQRTRFVSGKVAITVAFRKGSPCSCAHSSSGTRCSPSLV